MVGDALAAAVIAGTVSGAPSTLHALATGRSPLAAARAAGALVGRPGLPGGLVAHAVVTGFWSAVLAVALPRHRELVGGAVAGLAIAALDLGVIARRRYPAIGALPQGPQVLDHLAFGLAVGATLGARRGNWQPSEPDPVASAARCRLRCQLGGRLRA